MIEVSEHGTHMEYFYVKENIPIGEIPLVRPLDTYLAQNNELEMTTSVCSRANALMQYCGGDGGKIFVGEPSDLTWTDQPVIYMRYCGKWSAAVDCSCNAQVFITPQNWIVGATTNNQYRNDVGEDALRVIGLTYLDPMFGYVPIARVHECYAGNLVVLYPSEQGRFVIELVNKVAKKPVDHLVLDVEGNDQTPWPGVPARRLTAEVGAVA